MKKTCRWQVLIVPPGDGFGDYKPGLEHHMPREMFPWSVEVGYQLTGFCPNHPREDVDSFLRFAQAVRGIFFGVKFDLTSRKILVTASHNLIAKLFGQQPV